MVDKVLKELSPEFNKMYSKVGRPSIPPEQLLRALLLQMLYSVRSERMLIEEIDYNILFRWFVGLNLDDAVWDATVFTKNRDRLLEAEVAKDFLALVVEQARGQGWASDEHFTVDGSLLEAWASAKKWPRTFWRWWWRKRVRLRRMIPEIPRWIIGARSARTKRTSRKMIPKRRWRAKVQARRPS